MNVFITGLGCISPLGVTVQDNVEKLRNSQDGIVRPKYLSSKYSELKYFGEVPLSDAMLLEKLQMDSYGLTRTDLLAFSAFADAIADAGLSPEEISNRETAFISGSTVGGMCLTDQLYRDANLHAHEAEYVHSYNCAAHTLHIGKAYAMQGFSDTINTACSSSANAIMLGARLIKAGRCKRAIVGGVDSLAKYTVNGFNALQILSDEKCKPFDSNRSGLNLGEAGAYLVLESSECVSNKTVYAEVTGYGNTNDAFHTSSMSEEAVGVTRCIQQALAEAGLSSDDVDYINAHGTGTNNNDLVETTGFNTVFGNVPLFNSTKSYTGHTLGAAGSLEAIYTILAMQNNEVYESLRLSSVIEQAQGCIAESYVGNKEIRHAMSNSYGFGGNCTSLIFSKV